MHQRAFRQLICLMACTVWMACASVSAQVIFTDSFEPRHAEGPHSAAEAAKFLTQATFGPTMQDIQHLQSIGYNAWFEEQFNAPASKHLVHIDDIIADYESRGQELRIFQDRRQEAFWKYALYGQDQLRQRMAFALSEIFVISDDSGLEGQIAGMAHYYDVLVDNAFGSYRTLLQDVTLHPTMGHYLSMIRNRKPGLGSNSETECTEPPDRQWACPNDVPDDLEDDVRPDENYAREIMQLFSVGLVQLNLNGTQKLSQGQPIPTYNQDTIRGFAHVFTGWNFGDCEATQPTTWNGFPNFLYWRYRWCYTSEEPNASLKGDRWRMPMAPWGEYIAGQTQNFGDAFHDSGGLYHAFEGNKQLLNYNGVALPNGVLPEGGSARSNLTKALDNIHQHPNVAPFIATRLIQRFTTSNPSPAYVQRVATIFNNNGSGVRGDLGAVVRAILMDPEARDPSQAPTHFGKLKEPLIRLTQIYRALDARTRSGRIFQNWPEQTVNQAVLRSPTVFNFFMPDFSEPGAIQQAGLASPEFQISTDTYLIRLTDSLGDFSHWAIRRGNNFPDGESDTWQALRFDLMPLYHLADRPDALLDHLDLLLMQGTMPNEMRAILKTNMERYDVPGWTPSDPNSFYYGIEHGRLHRVQDTLWLITSSPAFAVERHR